MEDNRRNSTGGRQQGKRKKVKIQQADEVEDDNGSSKGGR